MNFCTEIRGIPVQVVAIMDRPYPQAEPEVEILSVTMEGGRQLETTEEENAQLRSITYARYND